MKPEDVLEIAQQGNPKFIAAIINRTTEPHGIFVRIARRGGCLYVLVEGDVAGQQDALVSFIQVSLQKLQLQPIKSAIVYGRQKGSVKMSWSESIKVVPAVVAPATNAIPPFTSPTEPTMPRSSNHEPALPQPGSRNAGTIPSSTLASPSETVDLSPDSASGSTQVTTTQLSEPYATSAKGLSEAMDGQGAENSIHALYRQTSATTQTIDRQQSLGEKGVAELTTIASENVSSDNASDALQTDAPQIDAQQIEVPQVEKSQVKKSQVEKSQPDPQSRLREQQSSLESAFEHPSAIKPTPSTTASNDTDLFTLSEEEEGEFIKSDVLKMGLADDISDIMDELSDELVDNSAQLEDVIPSDLERCKTRLLNVPSSNTDDLEQEDLQVGNSQKTVGLLDSENDSLENNSQPQTINAAFRKSESDAEMAPTPASLNSYGPDSITTKFNHLVSSAPNLLLKEGSKESSLGIPHPPTTSTEGPFSPKADSPPEENTTEAAIAPPPAPIDASTVPKPAPVEPLATEASAIPLSLVSKSSKTGITTSDEPEVQAPNTVEESSAETITDKGKDTTAEADAIEAEESKPIKAEDDVRDSGIDVSPIDEREDGTPKEAAERLDESQEANETEDVAPDEVRADEGEAEESTAVTAEEGTTVAMESEPAIAKETEEPAAVEAEGVQTTEVKESEVAGESKTETAEVPRIAEAEESETIAPTPTTVSQSIEGPDESISDKGDRITPDIEKGQDIEQGTDSNSNAAPDLDQVDVDAFIKCPEALILILFTIAFFIWQTYIAILDNAAPEGTLTASKLAQRLDVSRSTISRRKQREDFIQWSQSKDPDGLAWIYQDGLFIPQMNEEGNLSTKTGAL